MCRSKTFLMCFALMLLTAAAGADIARPIASGDVLFIDVHRSPELSSSSQVDGEGRISLPYIGFVRVKGMTDEQASQHVERAFSKILRNPRVTVSRSGGLEPSLIDRSRTVEMRTELIELHHANAENLSIALSGMSSTGGSISPEPDTNTLVVTDTPTTLEDIKRVVRRLDGMDSQLAQVSIEAKFVEVRAGAVKEMGVRWWVQGEEGGGGYYPSPAQDMEVNQHRGTSNIYRNEQVETGLYDSLGRRYLNKADNWGDRRMQIPLHVPSMGQMFFGFTNPYVDIGTLIDALVADKKAELLANPMIVTVNHKEAEMKMADEFAYNAAATVAAGATHYATDFIDVGIKMRVTPHIHQDSRGPYVKLDLHPEVSYVAGTSNGTPVRSVRSYDNTVNVRDKQTLVIGGVFRRDDKNYDQAVPVLGKLPGIGNLFKHKERSDTKTELMIFVTPTIHATPEELTWTRASEYSGDFYRPAGPEGGEVLGEPAFPLMEE